VPQRSAAAHFRPRNGFGALSPRSFLPRRSMPQLFYCSALCPFRCRRFDTVMIFPLSPSVSKVAGTGGLCHIGGDLRRNRLSWVRAAPHRTAPRSAGCDSDFLALLHGAASQQSLGNAGDGPHRVWRRRTARASCLILWIAYSGNDRSHHDGHWAVRLLVGPVSPATLPRGRSLRPAWIGPSSSRTPCLRPRF
jgi:hypothetical protein